MDKEAVLNKLSNYSYYSARLEETREQHKSICYKVTATYGNLAGSGGGGYGSKVEDMGNRRIDLERKMREYKAHVSEVYRMIEKSGLDEREKKLMWCIANNEKLQAFARREHIGKDNVYKIRDRAIEKIIAANKTRNVR